MKLLRLLTVLAVIAAFAWLIGRAIDVEQASARGPQVASVAVSRAVAAHEPASLAVSYHTVQQTICRTFGRECQKALRVAWCESRFNVRAVGGGGRYWGLFQQGAYSRARYGFGWTALEQARAAKRMRDREGWRPWPVCGRR